MYANKETLLAQVQLLVNYINLAEKQNSSVSKASVGWHIDHSLLVIKNIVKALEQSDPSLFTAKFNWRKFIIYTFNRIPRGRARAPKFVVPTAPFDIEETKLAVEVVKISIAKLDELHPNNYFLHPFFGNLNLKQTRKMLWLHSRHHLHIIRDIIGK